MDLTHLRLLVALLGLSCESRLLPPRAGPPVTAFLFPARALVSDFLLPTVLLEPLPSVLFSLAFGFDGPELPADLKNDLMSFMGMLLLGLTLSATLVSKLLGRMQYPVFLVIIYRFRGTTCHLSWQTPSHTSIPYHSNDHVLGRGKCWPRTDVRYRSVRIQIQSAFSSPSWLATETVPEGANSRSAVVDSLKAKKVASS